MRIPSKPLILACLIILLVLGLLMRIQAFRSLFPVGAQRDDVNRDYLVAHHIVAYNEYPQRGPDSIWRTDNSPAYFYLIAAPLLLRDNFFVLGFFNIILQLLALLFVFMLARTLFGIGTAFIAAILFGFNQAIIFQSVFIWQPHAMQPFVILSYALLAFGYTKQKFSYLIASIVFFSFSVMLHNSVLAVAPFYLFFLLLGVKNLGGSIKHYGIAALTCIVSFGLLYAPLFFYLQGNGTWTYQISFLLSNLHWSTAAAFLIPTYGLFFKVFLGYADTSALSIFVVFTMATVTLYYFLCSERNIQQKKVMLAMALCIASLLFAASFLPLRGAPTHWYFAPVLGLAFIFFAEIVNSLRAWALKIVLIVLILYLSAPNTFPRIRLAVQQFATAPGAFFSVPYQPPPFLAAVQDEIFKIKETEKRDGYDFFGFRVYAPEPNGQYTRRLSEEIFWNPLEIETRIKLTKVDDNAVRSYRPLTDEQYIFLACDDSADTRPCLDVFLKDSPGYEPQKSFLAQPYQIYLTRRN
ncbi:MAG: hypothetical protein A3G64_00290 [Candidatus Liptonbacteria bacterium RIFCSPLOWO2_12_FULL_60_15]|uniref:Glycosyltransferase RgtA/B/C/D-like domain-containing protein n=1 Tax=Candidatus Liptonbacteria bacterium RIFCSPLOWO2_12_FULL_60_15 TaxID=1798653 RepID=A0A1G2CK62_9BACT|nr:MAG: hypothetical protein A3G64_00290 [Candidatus Liptonbacteria bacterium RIFCSPLOWO2_12_FULL_60_15]